MFSTRKGRRRRCSTAGGSSRGCPKPPIRNVCRRQDTLLATSLDTDVFAQDGADERESALRRGSTAKRAYRSVPARTPGLGVGDGAQQLAEVLTAPTSCVRGFRIEAASSASGNEVRGMTRLYEHMPTAQSNCQVPIPAGAAIILGHARRMRMGRSDLIMDRPQVAGRLRADAPESSRHCIGR